MNECSSSLRSYTIHLITIKLVDLCERQEMSKEFFKNSKTSAPTSSSLLIRFSFTMTHILSEKLDKYYCKEFRFRIYFVPSIL